MKLSVRINFRRLKSFFDAIPLSLAKHSFAVTMVFFLVALIIGGFVYYQYFFLIQKKELNSARQPLRFEEKIFQELIVEKQKREDVFREIESKNYPDLFRSSTAEND